MNSFFNLNRIEFLITKRCNANCRHCSVPINSDESENGYQDINIVKNSLSYLIENYPISSIMAYGGEPILYIDNVVELFKVAFSYNVPSIELITSGFISKNESKESVYAVVDKLSESGVKRILLSVDAFHQERIPVENVEWFLERTVNLGFCSILLHPAWLVSKQDCNPYNERTQELLKKMSKKYGVGISGGNYIIPSGNNKTNIGMYYRTKELTLNKKCGEIPYTNPLDKISSVRVLPNGNINICRGITIGNINYQSIAEIIKEYSPNRTAISALIYSEGTQGLLELAKKSGISINPCNYYGTCDFCADCVRMLQERGVQ